jgi:AcrR family transcriptional regulator
MSGLRERQRERRERDIIKAARDLLRTAGYTGTSIEKIAARAEVSVGTVYNYFRTKADLVQVLFLQDVKVMLEKGKQIIADPPDDAAAAITALLEIYARGMAQCYEKKMMRDLFGSFFSESTSFIKEVYKLDFRLAAQLVEMMKYLQKRGSMAPDIKAEDAAIVTYAVFGTSYILYVSDDGMALNTMLENMQRGLEVVFHGLKPR